MSMQALELEECRPTESEIQVNSSIIEERAQEMEQIADDVENLHGLFQDMALLVEEQGESINTIADNIESTVEHTNKANVELEKASKYAKKTNVTACTLLGGIIGAAVGGPGGFILGGKTGAIALGLSSSLFCGCLGRQTRKCT